MIVYNWVHPKTNLMNQMDYSTLLHMRELGDSNRTIAKKLGVSYQTILKYLGPQRKRKKNS